MAFHLLTFNRLVTVASVESFSKRVRIQWSSFAIGSFSFTGIGVLQALREPQKHNPNYKLNLNTKTSWNNSNFFRGIESLRSERNDFSADRWRLEPTQSFFPLPQSSNQLLESAGETS